MRNKFIAIIMIIALEGLLFGCQSTEEFAKEHPTGTGAGIGAATGAVLGGLIGGNTTGVVVGGLLGGLAGGAVGHYAYGQKDSRDTTANAIGYQPSQGDVLRIEKTSASPTTVNPGGTVNLNTTYALITPDPQAETDVAERTIVSHNGKQVGDLQGNVRRGNGTFTSSVPLHLPGNAEPGTYEVTTTLQAAGKTEKANTTFQVK